MVLILVHYHYHLVLNSLMCLVWCRRKHFRPVRCPDGIPLLPRNRYWSSLEFSRYARSPLTVSYTGRIPSRISWLRRKHRGTESRHSSQMVYFLYRCADRLRLCGCCTCSYDCRPDNHREPLASCLESLPWPGSDSSIVIAIPAVQTR
jgi:hypothetical protein